MTDASTHTFFARFFRSLRNLREAFSTLGERPAYGAKISIDERQGLAGHENGGGDGTHPHQAVSWLKLFLCLLAIINQREARTPATTKEGLESERNDARLVDLVNPGELFGQLGSGDRGSRGVKDIDDKLTAGKQAVCGEFSGADCNRGRVILEREKVRERRPSHTKSIIQIRRDPSSAFRHGFHQQSDSICFHALYETLQNDTHCHGIALRCVIL